MATVFALDAYQQEVKQRLVKLVVRVLRPLIRILLRHGMSSQEFTEISRWVYVDVALHDKEFALKSRSRQFKSRAAVITGLSRKEVLRLSEYDGAEALQEIEPYNRAARVLTGWTENPLFCTRKDKPKDLPIKGGTGSFHDLVRMYSGDVPPRAVLDELRRCGAVEIIDGDSVRLKQMVYFPRTDSTDMLDVVQMMGGDLLESLDYNMAHKVSKGEGRPCRIAVSARLPEAAMDEVRGYIRKELDALSRKVHHFISEREDKVKRSGRKYFRAGLGQYYFERTA